MNLSKRVVPFTIFIICASLVSGCAKDTPPVATEFAEYFVGIIYKGLNWSGAETTEAEATQKAHRANIRRLENAGKMVLAGPFGHDGDMRGLFSYKVDTIEEAQKLVDTDPAVMVGQLRVDLYSWWGPKSLISLKERKRSG